MRRARVLLLGIVALIWCVDLPIYSACHSARDRLGGSKGSGDLSGANPQGASGMRLRYLMQAIVRWELLNPKL